MRSFNLSGAARWFTALPILMTFATSSLAHADCVPKAEIILVNTLVAAPPRNANTLLEFPKSCREAQAVLKKQMQALTSAPHEDLAKEFSDPLSQSCPAALEFRIFLKAAQRFSAVEPDAKYYNFFDENDARIAGKSPRAQCARMALALANERKQARDKGWSTHLVADRSPVRAPAAAPVAVKDVPVAEIKAKIADAPKVTEAPKAVEVAKPVAAPAIEDLHDADMKKYFDEYSDAKIGSDPKANVQIYGLVFAACEDKFKFSNSLQDANLPKNNRVGFIITDLGGGRTCQEQLLTSCKKPDHDAQACQTVRFSEKPWAKLSLSAYKMSGVVGLCYATHKDQTPFDCDPLPSAVSYRSAEEVRLQALKDAEAFRQAQIAAQRKTVNAATCYNTSGGLDDVEAAIEKLSQFHGFASDTAEKAARDKLRAYRLKLLESSCAKAKVDELDACKESLHAWADGHPEDVEAVGRIYIEMAQKFAGNPTAKSDDFDRASDFINEALNLDLKDSTKADLNKDLALLEIGKCRSYTSLGFTNNMALAGCYQSLSQQYMQKAQSACMIQQVPGQVLDPSVMQGCQGAMSMLQTIAGLPRAAMQAEQQKYAMQMAIQNQMNQAMNGSPNNGMPGAQNPNAMAFGGPASNMLQQAQTPSLTGQNPQLAMNNPYPYGNPISGFNPYGGYGGGYQQPNSFYTAGMNPIGMGNGFQNPGFGNPGFGGGSRPF